MPAMEMKNIKLGVTSYTVLRLRAYTSVSPLGYEHRAKGVKGKEPVTRLPALEMKKKLINKTALYLIQLLV